MWVMRGCPVCRGDLTDVDVLDQGWVVCFACGRSYQLADLRKGKLSIPEYRMTPYEKGKALAG